MVMGMYEEPDQPGFKSTTKILEGFDAPRLGSRGRADVETRLVEDDSYLTFHLVLSNTRWILFRSF
jgi:hypothetical protein